MITKTLATVLITRECPIPLVGQVKRCKFELWAHGLVCVPSVYLTRILPLDGTRISEHFGIVLFI